MPYEMKEMDGEFCVFEADKKLKCYKSKAEANDYLRALYANVEDAKSASDLLISFGDEIKAINDTGLAGGFLVSFTPAGDYDATDDRFANDTDLGDAKESDVYYHHGMDEELGKKRLGKGALDYQPGGVWIEKQLDLADRYEKAIWEMVKAGKLRWSSGTASHLVERKPEGKGFKITKWPLGLDASLTPAAAEYRNRVIPLKSYPVKALSLSAPQAEAEAAGNAAPQAESATNTKTQADRSTEATMADETKAAVPAAETKPEPQPDVMAELKALREEIKAMKGAPAVNIAAPSIKKVTTLGFSNDEMKSFAYWLKTGDLQAYKGAWQGQTDNEGGYAVPDDFYNQVIEKRDEVSVIRRIGVKPIPTTHDRVLAPTESTAATKLVRTAEEGSYNENEPVYGQMTINIHKYTKLIKVSEEFETDSSAGMAWLANVWGRAMGLTENYYCFNVAANGSNQPESVTYAATAGTACASQTATTAAELVGLIYAIGSAYSDNLVLVMRRATLGAFRGLQGNPFNFIPNNNFSIATGGADTRNSAGFIHDIPVYCTDDLPAQAAAVRHIVLFNPDFYCVAERQGLSVMRNPWLYQENGQIGYFANARFGAALAQAAAAYYLPSKT